MNREIELTDRIRKKLRLAREEVVLAEAKRILEQEQRKHEKALKNLGVSFKV